MSKVVPLPRASHVPSVFTLTLPVDDLDKLEEYLVQLSATCELIQIMLARREHHGDAEVTRGVRQTLEAFNNLQR